VLALLAAVLVVAVQACSEQLATGPDLAPSVNAPSSAVIENQATVYAHHVSFSRTSQALYDSAMASPTAIANALLARADSLDHARAGLPSVMSNAIHATADSLRQVANAMLKTAQQVADSLKKDEEHWEQCTLADSLVLKLTPNGGQMSDHGNSIVFPKGAVSQNVTIRMYPILGRTIAVRFEPEGLVFNPTAQPLLTLNTDCIGNPPMAHIVYEDNSGNRIFEWLLTVLKDQHSVSAYLEHFSRYAVDW
jgi:hypothetical protein